MSKGNLFVISGPSGAGKGTLVARLLNEMNNIWLSISATTRKPRVGEKDGISYFFLSKEEFERGISKGDFLEWAQYGGNYYGTPRKNIDELVSTGHQVVLEIETQGALIVKEQYPQACLLFIEPPSLEELERRLVSRGTDSEEVIKTRLEIARGEMILKSQYEASFINDNLDELVEEVKSYMIKKMNE